MKHYLSGAGLLVVAFFLSGCSLPNIGGGGQGTIWKSSDNGVTFELKNKVDAKRSISTAEVLSFVQDPQQMDTFYVGTRDNGIFRTEDGGETWTPLYYPPIKVYGLTIDERDHTRLYATGSYQDIGKVYRSDTRGDKWDAVYTEPGSGTVVTAMAESRDNPDILFVGTSAGVIVKTTDGGATWINLKRADGPVTELTIDRGNPEAVTALVLGKGLIRSANGGKDWDQYYLTGSGFGAGNAAPAPATGTTDTTPRDALFYTVDPSQTNVLYLGSSNGVFRSTDNGKTWTALNVIESSKKFPIRAIAVNPANRNELVYVSGATFYKSINGGQDWSTVNLTIPMAVGSIVYDRNTPQNIYLGLRKF